MGTDVRLRFLTKTPPTMGKNRRITPCPSLPRLTAAPSHRFPRSQSKCLRTTNPLERLCEELRRRTKTQGSLGDETSALVLLWSSVAFGQIVLRKIGSWKDTTRALKIAWQKEAA